MGAYASTEDVALLGVDKSESVEDLFGWLGSYLNKRDQNEGAADQESLER